MLLWRTIRDLGDQLQQQQSREGGSNRLSINTSLVRLNIDYCMKIMSNPYLALIYLPKKPKNIQSENNLLKIFNMKIYLIQNN